MEYSIVLLTGAFFWVSEQLEISVGRVQMNFLHLLSSEAVQHIIIHCLNVPVWRLAEDQPAAKGAVSFKAWSGEIIEVGGELEPHIIEDSCWVRTTCCHLLSFFKSFFGIK